MGAITVKKVALAVAGACAFLLVGAWPGVVTVVGIVAWAVYALI